MTSTLNTFDIPGTVEVSDKLEPVLSASGLVCGYKLPDGSVARMVMALEVESADGTAFKYVTAESDIAALGFEGLDYGDVGFMAVGSDVETSSAKSITLSNGIANVGDEVEHTQHGTVVLAHSEELGMHYLRYGYASYGNDFENLTVIESDTVLDVPRG